MEYNQEFTMKEAVAAAGLSEHTIRNYIKEFNIQITQTEGGHRRFTSESIKQLKLVKKMKEERGLSIKQIRAYFNGETPDALLENSPETSSNIEKKLESLEEQVQDLVDLNKNLVEKLDEQEARHQNELAKQAEYIVDKLSNEVEKRDRELLSEMNESQKEEKKSNFLSKISKKMFK